MSNLHMAFHLNRSAGTTYLFWAVLPCFCLLLTAALSPQAPKGGEKAGITFDRAYDIVWLKPDK